MLSPDVAGDRNPRRDADPEVDLGQVVREAGRQCPRGEQRIAGRVLAGNWRAEHAQRRIALELVDQAAVLLDDLDNDSEEPVEHPHHLGRRNREGERG